MSKEMEEGFVNEEELLATAKISPVSSDIRGIRDKDGVFVHSGDLISHLEKSGDKYSGLLRSLREWVVRIANNMEDV